MQNKIPAPGVEINTLQGNAAFEDRACHGHGNIDREEGMTRLARVFAEEPERILQELVDVACELCGADSAGVSIEEPGGDAPAFRWAATSGRYAQFQGARLPDNFAPCSICLERGTPQHFRVGQEFFDLLQVPAEVVTDGMLFPWSAGRMRGTIWIVAHERTEAFDAHDYKTVQVLSDFAAIGVRHYEQQEKLMNQTNATAIAALANELAHQINNPLQSLTNILYLAKAGHHGAEAQAVGKTAAVELERLSDLVRMLLALPKVLKVNLNGRPE
jgi:signal transduction histidine kinase